MSPVYEIFTKISLVNNISSGLAAISAQVFGLQGHFKNLEKSIHDFDRVGRAVLGGAGIALGTGVFLGLKKITDQAKELSHELVQIQKLGINPAQFQQARKAAFGLHAQVPGTTSAEGLRIYGQTFSPLGHDNAIKMMKPLAEFAQVLGNTTGDYKGAVDKVYDMVRAGDLMGKFMNNITHQGDTDALMHFLDLGSRVTLATHGNVGPATWFGMAQQGAPALSGMTDQGMLTMAIAAQAMGGQRAGTALTSLYQQMIGGKMTQYAAQGLQGLGLVGGYSVGRGGHLLWDEGALKTPFAEMLKKDPIGAVKMMQEAMVKQGLATLDQQVPQLFTILGRQTTQRLVHDLLRNMPQIMQERGRIAGGLGTSAAFNLQNSQDYEQVMHNFDAAWTEMVMHIGLPITMAAIPVMKEFTRVFDAVAEFAKANPETIRKIATAFAAFGTVLIGAGVVALISAISAGGWLIVGLTALIALNWETLGPPLKAFVSAMASFAAISWDIFVVGFKGLVGVIKELYGMVTGAPGAPAPEGTPWNHAIPGSYRGGGFGPGGMGHHASYGGAAESLSGGLVRGAGDGKYASRMHLLGRDTTGGGVKGVIDAAAARHGIDPRILYGIIAGESSHGNQYDSNQIGESSWSMFQLNRAGGLGNVFEKMTGLDVRDPHSIPAIADFVAGYAASGKSLSPWRGYRGNRDWNPKWGSMGYSPPHPNHGKIGTVAPFRRGGGRATDIHVHTILDGREMAHSVSRHFVKDAEHSRQAPHFDGYSQYFGPDRQTSTG